MQALEKYYVAIWCLFMPVTSLVIIPAVQGTIIAYVFGMASIGFVLLKINSGQMSAQVAGYFKSLLMVAVLWTVLFVGSQLSDMVNPLNVQSMYTISDESGDLLRASLFTQSIYLMACVMIALYFRYFFDEAWMKYVYWGAWFFALYGLYDWAFFLVFQTSGDFLANRSFAQGDHPGSWSQGISIAGLSLLRLKSCLGEPSFCAAVVIPYLLMAIDGRKRLLTAALFVAAILTTSTTVYLGMAFSFAIQVLWSKQNRGQILIVLGLVLLVIAAMAAIYPDTFRALFTDKFSGDNDSGAGRLGVIDQYENLFGRFNVLNWLFGVGFGYLYFSLAWSLTANTGIIGVGSFLYVLLKPAFLLPRERGSEWLKISMVAMLIVIVLTISELFIPTTWMFIGLAFRKLDEVKARRAIYPGSSPEDAFANRGLQEPTGRLQPVGTHRAA
jgi:hypothetical protein